MEKKLNNEILKNKKLEDEIKKVKDEVEKYKKECEKLMKENEQIKKEKIKLNEDLTKAQKLLGGIQINQIANNELKKLKDENNVLRFQLNIKDNEINDLKTKISKYEPTLKPSDFLIVYFRSTDESNPFNQAIKCFKSETFAEVEEKLYKKKNELRETNNNFTANALPILRFKTIAENHIKDEDIILLYKIE